MKRMTLILSAIFVLFSFSSCQNKNYNKVQSGYLSIAEENEDTYMKSYYVNELYHVDFRNRTFKVLSSETFDGELSWSEDPIFKYEVLASVPEGVVPEGYEGVTKYITDCKTDSEKSIAFAYGRVTADVLIGYVQVYKDAASTYYPYATENLDHSLLFEYNAATDAFTVTEKIQGAAVVAVQGDTAVYWKNKSYYRYDVQTKKETLLVEDKGYNSGITDLSYGFVLSNDQYCVLCFHKSGVFKYKDYAYVLEYATGAFYELKNIE